MNNPAPVFAAERLVPFEGIVQLRDAQAAVYAADGYTRSTGRPALVITRGVAQALQAASGLLTSWGDKQPVVVLNRVHPDQFASLRKTYSAVTRSSFTLDAPGDARIFAETNKRALPLAVPIQWLLPENTDLAPVLDAWSGMGSEHSAGDIQGETGWEDAVAMTVETLGAARKPVVLLGAGAAARVDPGLIAELARRLDCPVLLTAAATTMAVDALEKLRVAMDSAGALIPSGNLVWVKALGSADVILAIGTALSEVDWFGFTQLKLSRRAKILRIGLEKVEREIGHRFIQMDARRFVSELIRKLSGGPHGPAQGIRTSRWRRARDRWLSVTAAEAERCRSLNYIEPRFAIREIAQAAPAETLFISEGGACGMWLWSALWLRPFIFPVQHGTIGVPIPMAVGAAVGHPGRPIWGVVGDGAFLYNAKELETLQERGLAAVFFVFNDSSWSSIRLGQTFLSGGRYVGTDLPPTNYARMAQVYGCQSRSVTTPRELTEAVQVARAHRKGPPLVIDINLPKDHVPYAGANFVMAELDGAMRSLLAPSALGTVRALARGTISIGTIRSLIRVGR